MPTGTRIEPIWSSLSRVFAVERGAPHELPIRTIVYSGEQAIRKLRCTPEGGVVVWEREVPIVVGESGRITRADDAIIYATDDELVCLNLADGQQRWSRPCGESDSLTSFSPSDGSPREPRRSVVDVVELDGVAFEINASSLEVEGRWRHEFGAWEAMSLAVVGARVAVALGRDTDPNTARLALVSLDRITASIDLGPCDNAHSLELQTFDDVAIVRGSTTWVIDAVAERLIATIAPDEPAVLLVGSLAAWRHAL